ncbi:hypothetical protein [Sporolactobacillus terrae]|uniref:hypothetical protein n=1 Tax=Sporolactobacillus terrae TaxID=269673 RepID=UPI000684C2CD|nr:hypothetical protein [Sporolactobacillus terrae]
MYLEKRKANGQVYIYLMQYAVRENYVNNKRTVFRFGRADRAKKKIKHWSQHFHMIPMELLDQGITKSDLEKWMKYIEQSS